MTPPASPYATTLDVAALHLQKTKGNDFVDGGTVPGNTLVGTYIGLISSQINMRFRQAGFIVPFVALAGETWPSDQTDYLKLLCMLGTSGMIAGPTVANPGVRGTTNNVFTIEYRQHLDDIYNRQTHEAMPFRADYYSQTPAERVVGEVSLPTTSHLDEVYDPARHYGLYRLTQKSFSIRTFFEDQGLYWDYAWALNNLNKGLGSPRQEAR